MRYVSEPKLHKRPILSRRLGLDVPEWAVAILVATVAQHSFGLTGIDPWRVLLVIGLALIFQVGCNLFRSVYTGWYRLGTLHELAAAARAVGATTALLIAVNLGVNQLLPTSAILAGGGLALALMGVSRLVWHLNRKRGKRKKVR